MTARAANAGQPTGSFLTRAIRGFVAAIERRRAYRALMELDDRMLADIGVTRGTIRERLAGATAEAAVPAQFAPVASATAPRPANEDARLHDAA